MIEIQKSKTADTRTCDFTKVTKETLLASSVQHIEDVRKGFEFFKSKMDWAAENHDFDKIRGIDGFHADFVTGFKNHSWWDFHKGYAARHHLLEKEGVRDDVNLVDVLDMIVDCVMAGMGRSGSVYPLKIEPEVLKKAFDNTVELLKSQVVVKDEEKAGVV
jgi:hypothetical protein